MPKGKFVIKKFFLVAALIVMATAAALLLTIIFQLPDINALNSYIPSETTLILASDGEVLARLHREENRQVVPLTKISPYLQKCVVSVEDPDFYKHHGFNLSRIFKATLKNLAYGRIVEGGSTITQQLARNLFLTRKKKIIRKLAEIFLAMQIERRYTKEEVLEMYLNQVYFGHNTYGIESAASLYYGKKAQDLTLAESAIIAGLIRGPELYSPYRNFKGAKKRQIFVINKALEQKLVTVREAKLAAITTLEFSPKNLKRHGKLAPYFISHVLKELLEQYGEETVYHGGLRVYTTLDSKWQARAEELITNTVSKEGEKWGFSQAALVSVDPRTGYIKSMVGGVDFIESKFNCATQAKRSPGSSFKPFIYAAAMEQGISPGTIIKDELTTFEVYPNEWNPDGVWTPKNFDDKFHGPVTVQHALEKSLNIPSIKLIEQVGIKPAIKIAKRLGIKSHLEGGLALTLGASEVTLLEQTSAFGVFANAGIRVEPTAITKIENREGVILYKHTITEKKALDPNIAAVMNEMMQGVVLRGTGYRARMSRPVAAKTGTSQEQRDSWFVGFVPQLVTGVWIGNDDNTPMKGKGFVEVGIAPQIWKEFNITALANQAILNFPKPEGLVKLKICLASGKKATDNCPTELQKWVNLWRNNVPADECGLHRPAYEFFGTETITNTEEAKDYDFNWFWD